MADSGRQRRLAAILVADAVGYSRLMGQDEDATVAAIAAARTVFAERAGEAGGRVVNAPGDSILAEFGSVVDAVAAAVDIQQVLGEGNAPLPEAQRMAFRIGINLGDVLVQDGAIYGDGVNVAARLESLADPGGVCVTRNVYDQVKAKLPLEFEYLGEHAVKNIAEPVRVYRVQGLGTPARDRPVSAAPLATGTPARPSVAVLPFGSMSADPAHGYFCDGLTEELIAALSRFTALTVIARNSSFKYQGQSVDIRDVGRDLGADYVIEGSVRQGRERIRVTAQLLTAATGAHLWAESYDRTTADKDELSVQTDLAEQIAGTIADRTGVIFRTRIEEIRREGVGRTDPSAAVLLAQGYAGPTLTSEMHAQVREALETAVASVPNYIDAWAALAHIYRDEYAYSFNPRAGPLERAVEAANRAIELDATHQSAHAAMYQALYFQRKPRFVAVLERSLELNPNSPSALSAAGLFLALSGQWERGMGLVNRAIKLNPDNPGWFHVPLHWAAYRAGNYAEALNHILRINTPGVFWDPLLAAINCGQLGRRAEATEAAMRIEALYPDFAAHARHEARKWFSEEDLVEHILDGLRKAGMDIPQD